MPPRIIPGTGAIYWANPNTGDRVINLKDHPEIDSALANEDIVIVGDFEDYSGSGTKPGGEVMMAGASNELAADLHATAAKEQHDEVTARGNRAATHRQRPKLVYIEKQ